MKKLKYSIFFLVLAFAGRPVCAWDVEHDELATLVGEFLPPEIKSFFTFDDFATLLAYCHFPDMTEWEPRRFHTLDDIEEVVGRRDREVIASRGFFPYWLHTEDGKATFMTLMARWPGMNCAGDVMRPFMLWRQRRSLLTRTMRKRTVWTALPLLPRGCGEPYPAE